MLAGCGEKVCGGGRSELVVLGCRIQGLWQAWVVVWRGHRSGGMDGGTWWKAWVELRCFSLLQRSKKAIYCMQAASLERRESLRAERSGPGGYCGFAIWCTKSILDLVKSILQRTSTAERSLGD